MLASSLPLILLLPLSFLTSAQPDNNDANTSIYSKFLSDANALLTSATGAEAASLNALFNWQVTQTAVPNPDLNSQYQDYLNAYVTTSSVPLPAWVTAVPSSLQPVATSFLQAEGRLVQVDFAPVFSSQEGAFFSALGGTSAPSPTTISASSSSSSSSPSAISSMATNSTTTTSAPSATAQTQTNNNGTTIVAVTTASNGTVFTTSSFSPLANGTTVPITTDATPSPTRSVTPPAAATSSHKTGGAPEKRSVATAALVGIFGVVGVMSLL